MRLVLWNCRNGLSNKKADFLLNYNADIYVLPELKVKNIELLMEEDSSLTFSKWVTNSDSKNAKGLGVISKKDYNMVLNPLYSPDMEIFLPIDIKYKNKDLSLLAVWNFNARSKKGPYKGQVNDNSVYYAAINRYEQFLKNPNTLVVGDWNFAPTFSRKQSKLNFFKLMQILKDLKLTSLYHKHFNEDYGFETVKTYQSFSSPEKHTIDYIHASPSLTAKMKDFKITPVGEVVQSDHAVLCVDFDLD